MTQYIHTFRYGPQSSEGKQRWAFRFGLPALLKSVRRGRPSASIKASCFSKTHEDESYFWSSAEAALECDLWKLHLTRFFSVRNLQFSLGSYQQLADTFMAKTGHDVEAYILVMSERSVELVKFLSQYESVLSQYVNLAEPDGWNPDVLLSEARRKVENLHTVTGPLSDLGLAHRRKDWAVEYADHCALVRKVESYGLGRLEVEVNVKVWGLKKILDNKVIEYSSIPEDANKPATRKGHEYVELLENMAKNVTTLKAALAECEATAKSFSEFKAMLAARTEELKKSKP